MTPGLALTPRNVVSPVSLPPRPNFLEPLEEETRLDRYELIGQLASGGMATVFLAHLAGVGGFRRLVAIKRLHPHFAHDVDVVQMFLDEARLAARIHHPHVVPILEIGTSERGYYVVMEYIEGGTLANLLAHALSERKKVPMGIVLRIAIDLLSGLHAAHELRDDSHGSLNLVHRDVSPQNILISVDGNARITDFGVAHASSRLASTQVGKIKGKLEYMAPEQVDGTAIDRRADVFAAAIVLWEAFAGQSLFRGETELETLYRLLFEPIPRLRSVEPAVPKTLEHVIIRALERDPDKRFATASEFAQALELAATEGKIPIASSREVEAHVDRVFGPAVAQQREAVRMWLSQSQRHGSDPRGERTLVRISSMPPPAASGSIPPRPLAREPGGTPRSSQPPPGGGGVNLRLEVSNLRGRQAQALQPRVSSSPWKALRTPFQFVLSLGRSSYGSVLFCALGLTAFLGCWALFRHAAQSEEGHASSAEVLSAAPDSPSDSFPVQQLAPTSLPTAVGSSAVGGSSEAFEGFPQSRSSKAATSADSRSVPVEELPSSLHPTEALTAEARIEELPSSPSATQTPAPAPNRVFVRKRRMEKRDPPQPIVVPTSEMQLGLPPLEPRNRGR